MLILAVVFGLSTDYEVFLMSRMVEAKNAGATTEEAVKFGTERTGRIVTAAALLLIVVTGGLRNVRAVSDEVPGRRHDRRADRRRDHHPHVARALAREVDGRSELVGSCVAEKGSREGRHRPLIATGSCH